MDRVRRDVWQKVVTYALILAFPLTQIKGLQFC